MLTPDDILSFNFYTYGKPYCGSNSAKGLRFRIVQEKRELPLPEGAEEGAKPETEKYFSVSIWPEPFCYEATDPSLIKKTEFPFTKDGYDAVLEHLNSVLEAAPAK